MSLPRHRPRVGNQTKLLITDRGERLDLVDLAVTTARDDATAWGNSKRDRSEMTKLKTSWPIRSTVAGTAGTATMTAAYATERRLRHNHRGPLDYDDSLVPGTIVAAIMHLGNVTAKEDNELGLALRWSYGSVFGWGTRRRNGS